MIRLLLLWLVNAAALWAAASLVDGIRHTGTLSDLLVVALVFGLINTFIKPVVRLLALPVRLLTLGLFSLVINAGLLWLTTRLADDRGFVVDGFAAAFWGALVVSMVSTVLGWFVPDRRDDEDDS